MLRATSGSYQEEGTVTTCDDRGKAARNVALNVGTRATWDAALMLRKRLPEGLRR